ncbi:DUF2336 domain-containing protein [Bradyrhizobium sp. LHD-71]|uniref:DUF2336 domain-containing protein n=1 Tax=Bradyrhizobium sp. LHD-71 TaxID=3072141 RepID=UPI00280E83B6|nr:DUF2336 domain-containing protein [Bradyrhizobium sp. LHD-71]MDQ8726548.1 DUF2336 domain-containing protein [Bradyrhizobium sp. LHD-71]
MIVRHFLGWVRTAPAGERAEATRALARAWLFSNMSADDVAATEGALLLLLDDPSPLVREAMACVFAHTPDAPPAIVRALATDQASVALPVLQHSPLLIDADLVDIVATGSTEIQGAVARRVGLPTPVCAAIAEVGSAEACLALIDNPGAQLAQMSLDRIVERFGHVAIVREQLLARHDLPATTRLALVGKLSGALIAFVTARNWLDTERAQIAAVEACERSTVNIAATSRADDLRALVRHLREIGQLTTGLILRALLSGNTDMFEYALAELTGLTVARVGAIVYEQPGSGLTALLVRAGFPASTFGAFRAALSAADEIGFVGTIDGAARLRRRMVERVLTSCAQDEQATEALLMLLRRFETESAREEARVFCDELIAAQAVQAAEGNDHLVAA